MEVVLRKYGNSAAVVLPSWLLRDLGLAAGQAMTLGATVDASTTQACGRPCDEALPRVPVEVHDCNAEQARSGRKEPKKACAAKA